MRTDTHKLEILQAFVKDDKKYFIIVNTAKNAPDHKALVIPKFLLKNKDQNDPQAIQTKLVIHTEKIVSLTAEKMEIPLVFKGKKFDCVIPLSLIFCVQKYENILETIPFLEDMPALIRDMFVPEDHDEDTLDFLSLIPQEKSTEIIAHLDIDVAKDRVNSITETTEGIPYEVIYDEVQKALEEMSKQDRPKRENTIPFKAPPKTEPTEENIGVSLEDMYYELKNWERMRKEERNPKPSNTIPFKKPNAPKKR
jgi:hypothetical protein